MAISEEWKDQGFYRKFSADCSVREIVDSNLESHGDPRFDEIAYVINDFTEVENFDLDVEDIRIIASLDGAAAISRPALKIAVVALNPDIVSWFRLYMECIEDTGYQSRLFTSVEDAREWGLERGQD